MNDTTLERLQRVKRHNELVALVVHIEQSPLSWEDKYDLIFSPHLSKVIAEIGFPFDYYDPDTSHEEDVQAYVRALVSHAINLRSSLGYVSPDQLALLNPVTT